MSYDPTDSVFEIDNTSKRQRNIQQAKRPTQSRRAVPAQKQSTRSHAVVAAKDTKGGVRRAVSVLWNQGLSPMLHTKNDARVKTVRAENKKPFPVSALFMAMVCTVLFMFMIVSYVQINEYTLEVSGLRTDLADMVAEDKELTAALEKKNDMLTIEEMAGELGMVKADQLTKKHITLTNEDKIEVVEPEPTEDETVVTTVMSGLWENFAGLREYLG